MVNWGGPGNIRSRRWAASPSTLNRIIQWGHGTGADPKGPLKPREVESLPSQNKRTGALYKFISLHYKSWQAHRYYLTVYTSQASRQGLAEASVQGLTRPHSHVQAHRCWKNSPPSNCKTHAELRVQSQQHSRKDCCFELLISRPRFKGSPNSYRPTRGNLFFN